MTEADDDTDNCYSLGEDDGMLLSCIHIKAGYGEIVI